MRRACFRHSCPAIPGRCCSPRGWPWRCSRHRVLVRRGRIRIPAVAHAVVEVDKLVSRLFAQHFGDPADGETRYHYLEAMHRFATDTLPPARQRYALVP